MAEAFEFGSGNAESELQINLQNPKPPVMAMNAFFNTW
jgi:hypothetical protein